MSEDIFQPMVDALLVAYRPLGFDLHFESTGRSNFVHATLYRAPVSAVPVMALGDSYSSAMSQLVQLMDKVVKAETTFGKIVAPDMSQQPHDNGYVCVPIGKNASDPKITVNARFKNRKSQFGTFVISAIISEDEEGFFVYDTPVEMDKTMRPISKNPNGPGDLYSWNTIGPLCGSAGVAVVVDGKVVRSKITHMA